MEILIRVLQFILSLSILIVLHELGHFIPAKLFKTKVEKFYLFFDPWFSLVKKKIGETEYGIGWLPLGGYVKISGMIDESMDKEQMQKPPEPWEFRSKPAWQRLIIMLGGVTVNIILPMFIYAMILFTWGEQYLPVESAKYGIYVGDSLSRSIGLQDGDKIISVGGKELESFSSAEISQKILLDEAKYIEVERNGTEEKLMLSDDIAKQLIKRNGLLAIAPRMPFMVKDFVKGSYAKEIGFQKGDQLVAVNGQSIFELREYVNYFDEHKGDSTAFTVKRNSEEVNLEGIIPESGKIGVELMVETDLFETEKIEYGFFESLPAGVTKTFSVLGGYISQFKLLFNPDTEAYKSLGGFVSIGKLFPAQWDWYRFWSMTALLSVMLAFMNILPIPALDGGHVLFLLYEIISGRKPGDKFLEYAQIAGMVILFSLLIFANANDFFKMF